MLSLEKTKALNEVKDFLGNVPYLAMCKMDGLTCSLKYENGELVSAETRGNGKVGENILHNAKVIPSIPKQIPYTGTLVIDGEIICTKEDFKEFENEYANPRNFASGSIRLLDSNECSKRKLRFVAWDVIEGLEDGKVLSDKLVSLKDFGFIIVPYIKAQSISDNMLNEISELIPSFAVEMSYPIDGIVFKFDNVEYGRSLGQTSHHFKNALAFKFADDTMETELIDIEWTMGRTGVLTPVAIFNPIELEGSVVSRASLHNISVMEEILGKPYVGQKVWVSKRNMIIPQIEKAEKLGQTDVI
jgi:DNA ligase (NAD+)